MRALLTAVVGFVVIACSTSYKESVRIWALGPTGDGIGRSPQPIWRFAITNGGNSNIVWMAGVEVKGGSDQDYSHAGGHIEWPKGVLGKGEGVVTNMIVPARAGSEWRGYVEHWRISSGALKKAQAEFAEVFPPGMEEFESVVGFCPLPQAEKQVYYDRWRTE